MLPSGDEYTQLFWNRFNLTTFWVYISLYALWCVRSTKTLKPDVSSPLPLTVQWASHWLYLTIWADNLFTLQSTEREIRTLSSSINQPPACSNCCWRRGLSVGVETAANTLQFQCLPISLCFHTDTHSAITSGRQPRSDTWLWHRLLV